MEDEESLVSSDGDVDGLVTPLVVQCIRQMFTSADLDELDHILGLCCPPGIFPDLLRVVLGGNGNGGGSSGGVCSPISVRMVLKHWPEETLRMSEVWPKSKVLSPSSRHSSVTPVLRAFLDALGHVGGRKLRVLDLRGFQLGDMDFLKNYKALLLDPQLAKTGCQIYLDLNITYANDYLLWNEILPRVQGIVKVAKLSTIFRTGFDSTKLILDALDSQILTSLVAKHLEMVNDEFVLLVDSMSRLTRLTELDLSCGMLRLSQPEDDQNARAVCGLARVLQSLPLLTTLNLSNNKLGTNVFMFFGDSDFALKSLALKNCGLAETDLTFLSQRGRMFSELERLDLGDNNLSEDLSAFVCFLGQLTKLRTLCLEECCLKESQARPVCEVIRSSLRQLTDLNLSGHKWGKVTLLECVHALVPRPALLSLVLPIYGISSLQFKFRSGEGSRPPLHQVLEPVAGHCSEVVEIRRAVEHYRNKRNGFKSMNFKINWLDGMSLKFKKHL